MGATKAISGLTKKQEKFCQLYATDREFFGNGVEAYMEAYEIPKHKWKSALAAGSRLLRNVKILERINFLIDATGLNDPHVDKQLYQVITQSADLKAKVAGIKEYNALRQRVKNKLEIDVHKDVKDALTKLASILP